MIYSPPIYTSNCTGDSMPIPTRGMLSTSLRPVWPTVPDASAGGAKSGHSTREHLLLCYLEHQALLGLVGPDRAGATLGRKTQDVVYPWVYSQVSLFGPALDTICTDHKLRPPRLATT
jgi:hypothetical protein